MSGEHFQTVLMETVKSRWGEIPCYMYAHTALLRCAEAIEEQPLGGLSGDMPDRRNYCAKLIRAVAATVEEMAYDAASDGAFTDEEWEGHLRIITHLVQFPSQSSRQTGWDSIVYGYQLTIEEEQDFEKFCRSKGIGKDATSEQLIAAFAEWTIEK